MANCKRDLPAYCSSAVHASTGQPILPRDQSWRPHNAALRFRLFVGGMQCDMKPVGSTILQTKIKCSCDRCLPNVFMCDVETVRTDVIAAWTKNEST
jgi:hypothetical protein